MTVQQISNNFMVKVAGAELPDQIAVDRVEVEHNLHLPDSFRLVLRDQSRTALQRAGLSIGAPVEVSVISDASVGPVSLVTGEVTALEAEFSGGSSSSVVRGYDESHRLFRGRCTASYQNMTYADIAAKVAKRIGLGCGRVDPTSPAHEHVTQSNESDWSFLSRLAAEVGFEVSVREGDLHFHEPASSAPAPASGDLDDEDPLRLTLGSNLLEFQATLSAAEQVKEVQVRGWDPSNKEPIVVDRRATTASIDNGSDPAAVALKFPAGPVVSVGTPHAGHSEVELAARALSERVAASHTEVEGTARGNPALRAGSAVRLELTGEPFDGTYVLTSTTHRYEPDEGYTTGFVISGRERRSLLYLAGGSSPSGTERISGVVTALVEDVNDPEELCRVRVRFPWLSDDYVSDWCRVVLSGAGVDRGWLVLPEPDDEVAVVFEQGDIRRPYVLGGLHNRLDPPKPGFSPLVDNTSGQVNGRSFRSRTGHHVVIVDDPDGSGIFLTTADERLRVSLDQAGDRVAIASKGDLEISVDGDLRITAGGRLEMSSRELDLDASGPVKVAGRTIQLN